MWERDKIKGKILSTIDLDIEFSPVKFQKLQVFCSNLSQIVTGFEKNYFSKYFDVVGPENKSFKLYCLLYNIMRSLNAFIL